MSRDEAAAASRALRHAAARYQSAADLPELIPFRDAGPALYHYSVSGPAGLVVSGLVGLVRVATLLPHEQTIREAEDREAVDLEIRPMLALTRAPLPSFAESGPPAVVTYGTQIHRVAPVKHRGEIDLGTLVLADGHHRRRSAMRHGGDGAVAMTMVVGDGGRGLRADAFQRRLIGAGPLPPGTRDLFEIEEIPRAAPRVAGIVWLEPNRRPRLLRPRPAALETMPAPLRPIGAAVAAHLLFPVLGITQDRIEHFSTPAAVMHALEHGDAGILLPRVPIPAVFAAAEAGTLLPPKGSRFHPKPVRGVVVRAQG